MKVETLSQAQTWDEVKSRYVKDGLCHKCAAQAAYGHQTGFKNVNPPCNNCEPVVATFEVAKAQQWRAHRNGRF